MTQKGVFSLWLPVLAFPAGVLIGYLIGLWSWG